MKLLELKNNLFVAMVVDLLIKKEVSAEMKYPLYIYSNLIANFITLNLNIHATLLILVVAFNQFGNMQIELHSEDTGAKGRIPSDKKEV